jgi:hypothetical protein
MTNKMLNLRTLFYLLLTYYSLFSFNNSNATLFTFAQTVKIKGFGDTENAALNDAKKAAIGKICGEALVGTTSSQSITQKDTKLSSTGSNSKSFNANTKITDENLIITGGSVRSYKIIKTGKENSITFVEIEAKVTDCQKAESLQNAISLKELTSELRKTNAEFKEINSTGLILNPKSLAQKYHNARILQQRGEIDLALKIYEELVKEKILFADPIQDMVKLSKRVYGREGSKKYIENVLSHIKGRTEYYYAIQLIDENNPIPNGWDIASISVDSFPPFAYLYLDSMNKMCFSKLPLQINACLDEVAELQGIDSYITDLTNKLKSGENINFYLDSNRAETKVAISNITLNVLKESKSHNEKMMQLQEKQKKLLNDLFPTK